MKKYLWFLALVLLLARVSTAGAIMLDYKSTAITVDDLLGIADNLSSSAAMTINVSLESGYYHNNFESLVLEIVNEILGYSTYPPITSSDLNGGATSPIVEPSTLLLMGLGLIGLAGMGRKQFKKKLLRVSSTKMTFKYASIT